MNLFKKLLSVTLVLVMCFSMASTAFAASLQDMKDAIEGSDVGEQIDGSDTFGYAKSTNETGETRYGITARTNEAGTREVELHEDVKLEDTLVIDNGDVQIELNGHEVRRYDDSKNFATDEDGNVTKWSYPLGSYGVEGTVIKVTGEDTKLAITDSTAVVDENNRYINSGTGKITGGSFTTNDSVSVGGGVRVEDGATFEMAGGNITKNQARSNEGGGGLSVTGEGSSASLTGVTISYNNAVNSYGGGIKVADGGSLSLTDTTVANNHAGADWVKAAGGGIYIAGDGDVDISGSAIYGNSAGKKNNADDIEIVWNPAYTGTLTIDETPAYRDVKAPEDGDKDTKYEAEVSMKKSDDGLNYVSTWGEAQEKRHSYGKAVVEDEVAATCTEDGSYVEVRTCVEPGCNHVDRKTVTIKANGHTPSDAVRENEVSATCSKTGSYDEVVYCSVCQAEISREGKTVEKLAHTPAEAVRENEVSATCSTTGSYDEAVYCSVCQAEISREGKTVEKLAHTPAEAVRENEVSATCSTTGSYDEVVLCSVCDEEISRESKTVDKLDHTPAEAVRENVVDAQAGVAGSYDEVVYCSVCEEELSREAKVIAALPAPVEPAPVEPVPVEPVPVDPVPVKPADADAEIEEADVPLANLPIALKPEDNVTRAQLVAILYWLYGGVEAEQAASFVDVASDSVYAEAIGWAEANGIAVALSGNRFAPDEFITRGQLVMFLNRFAQYLGSDLVLELDGDADEVLTWAVIEETVNDFCAKLQLEQA